VSPENSAYFAKNCEKISEGSFFEEKYGSGGAIKVL